MLSLEPSPCTMIERYRTSRANVLRTQIQIQQIQIQVQKAQPNPAVQPVSSAMAPALLPRPLLPRPALHKTTTAAPLSMIPQAKTLSRTLPPCAAPAMAPRFLF